MSSNKSTQFQPKLPDEKMVRTQVFLRPDQREAISLHGENMSEVMRRAIDMYLSIHPADNEVNYAAALDAMAADDSE